MRSTIRQAVWQRLSPERAGHLEDIRDAIERHAKNSNAVQWLLIRVRSRLGSLSSSLAWYELDRCGAAIARYVKENDASSTAATTENEAGFSDDEWREILTAAELHKTYLRRAL